MRWIQPHLSFLSSSPPPLQSPPPSSLSSSGTGNKISPVVLCIIVTLAVIILISGLLYVLYRFVIKKRTNFLSNYYPEMGPTDAYQRQLQQLFNIHDSGLDQTFIDALPVFVYKEIMGLKEPFDCAVCLCEFAVQDKLRLLPSCSHAFHISCIDTWLLTNSTCPLCRGTLFTSGFSIENPVFLLDDSMEGEENGHSDTVCIRASSGKQKEVVEGNIGNGNSNRVFSVRLGKFKTTSNDEGIEVMEIGETSNGNLNARRCYSMGSCQYVVDDSELQVACSASTRERRAKERLGQNGNSLINEDADGKKIIGNKRESFSVSKIWLWSKKGRFQSSSGSHLANTSLKNVSLAPLRDTSKTQPLRLNSTQPSLCPSYLDSNK